MEVEKIEVNVDVWQDLSIQFRMWNAQWRKHDYCLENGKSNNIVPPNIDEFLDALKERYNLSFNQGGNADEFYESKFETIGVIK